MKKSLLKKAILLSFLLLIYVYVIFVNYIPSQITIFEGESISLNTLFGINISSNDEAITVSADTNDATTNETGTDTLTVSLLNTFVLKEIDVSVISQTTVIPVGNIAGLKLYTNGVLVVGMSEIEGTDSKKYKPYENSGIEEGDTITKVNEETVSSTDDLIEKINSSDGNDISIEFIHDEETKECSITPVKTSDDEYKVGLWVRDSAAGVGTVTFYEPSTGNFGALGHGITDIDTGDLLNIYSGEFVTTDIISITKGEDGSPGKIQGSINENNTIGVIYDNTEFGVYGKINNFSGLNIDTTKEMQVALRDEIELGSATILCSLDNKTVNEYEIEITKINVDNNYDNKSMEIKVTDENLIGQTGGIIQGMSGCPIIQNGKFVGAVTHVLVNDSTKGYAIFGDLMIKQLHSVN